VDIFKSAAPRRLAGTAHNANTAVVARRAQLDDGTIRQGNRARTDTLSRPWDGSNKYNRVCEIGRGAYTTVYKVTMKLTGHLYAAKELDKRNFMKHGMLDQNFENEIKIIQRIKHVRQTPFFLD
jgi:hypothetical protein